MIQEPKDKNRLLMYRKESGYSQDEVGRLIGVDRRQVSVWELGDKSPNLANAFKLSSVYKMPVAYLFAPYHTAIQKEIREKEEELQKAKLIHNPKDYGEIHTKEPPRNPWL